MPDQQPDHVASPPGPAVTRESARRAHDEWTREHPPIPGLRWVHSFGADGQVLDRHLEVIPGWEDAFAPALSSAPESARRHPSDVRPPGETDRLGALAYQGWYSGLPERERECYPDEWADLREESAEPLRRAAALVWQHGENAGFHQALLRTLPSAQLGAAGELENAHDLITAQAITRARPAPGQTATPPDQITVNLQLVREELTARVQELRAQAAAQARRERDAGRDR